MMYTMARAICVIPARSESSRFPNKIFTSINGEPMFARVYAIAKASEVFEEVYVASHNVEVQEACEQRDIPFLKTTDQHPCGSSRVFEASKQVQGPWEVVVNLQADQPFLPKEYLKTVVGALKANPIATVAYVETEEKDEHTVKAVLNKHHEGIYFSRYPIPFSMSESLTAPKFCHLGLYAYTKAFATSYQGDFQSHLALSESLEQLDFIYHGYKIDVGIVPHAVPEVNTPEDLVLAKKLGLIQ